MSLFFLHMPFKNIVFLLHSFILCLSVYSFSLSVSLFVYVCMCLRVCVCVCVSCCMLTWQRSPLPIPGQFSGLCFLLLPRVLQVSNSSCQAWQQTSLPTNPSFRHTINSFHLNYSKYLNLGLLVVRLLLSKAWPLFLPQAVLELSL